MQTREARADGQCLSYKPKGRFFIQNSSTAALKIKKDFLFSTVTY